MPDYLSKVVYAKDAGDEYEIPFSYLDESHIKVSANGVLLTVTTEYTISGTTLTIIASSYDGDVTIYRETPGSTQGTRNTPENQYVNFTNGSVITESDLDNSTLQAIYVAQEAMDKALEAEAAPGSSGNVPGISSATDNYILTSDAVSESSVWSSFSEVQAILNVDPDHTASTIPIRDASTPPKILTDVTGNVIGNLTGLASTATALTPGGLIEITGDVDYTSDTEFTGAAVTGGATVEGIQGVNVADTAPSEGQVFAYRTSTFKWTPESRGVAIYTSQGAGDAIDGVKAQAVVFDEEDINTIPSSVTGPTANTYFALGIGTYLVKWSVPFYSSLGLGMAYTALAGSIVEGVNGIEVSHQDLKAERDAITYVAGTLASPITLKGRGSVTASHSTGIATSHGVGSFEVSVPATLYIQLLAYTQTNGYIGKSPLAADPEYPWNVCHSILSIEKTS